LSELDPKVKLWLERGLKAAKAIAPVVGGIEGQSISAAIGLVQGVVDLLGVRSVEATRELLYEMIAHPAKKLDLTDAERAVAMILAKRRARDTEEA
jgi:hypothetical protein